MLRLLDLQNVDHPFWTEDIGLRLDFKFDQCRYVRSLITRGFVVLLPVCTWK